MVGLALCIRFLGHSADILHVDDTQRHGPFKHTTIKANIALGLFLLELFMQDAHGTITESHVFRCDCCGVKQHLVIVEDLVYKTLSIKRAIVIEFIMLVAKKASLSLIAPTQDV